MEELISNPILTQTNPKNQDDKRIIWMDSTKLTSAQEHYSSIYGKHIALV